MEYHKDRFEDASVMVFTDDKELLAILPANRVQRTIVSHGGLTYGGLLVDPAMGTPLFLELFTTLLAYLKSEGFTLLQYKPIPHIYHIYPSDEDKYALFLAGARLFRRDVSSAIVPGRRLPFRKDRRGHLNKARRNALVVEESDRWQSFWEILHDNLVSKHGVRPVHSVDEIQDLRRRFPHNIRLFAVNVGQEVVAGTVVFETEMVAHTQYIASNDVGKRAGAVELLLAHLLENVYPQKPYFDFGISNTNDGRYLNKGLIDFKEGFGGRSVVHEFYELDIEGISTSALRADRDNCH
jgi:hypothetical protein